MTSLCAQAVLSVVRFVPMVTRKIGKKGALTANVRPAPLLVVV